MRELNVAIEINGIEKSVGTIRGNSQDDARFSYDSDYIEQINCPISISLPIQNAPFDAIHTKSYFEGLLPEGFSRQSVAEWMHADVNDYLTILANLGAECIGALRITESNHEQKKPEYVMISSEKVKALAAEGATKSTELLMESHLSLTGASGKVGLFYDTGTNSWYQPIGDAPSTHIVKQSHIRMSRMVVNELLCLKTAQKMGIDVPACTFIDTGEGKDESLLFATQRYDRTTQSSRIISGLKAPYRLHQEDFAQALGIAASDKYEKFGAHYMYQMFECLKRYSANPLEDQLRLWERIVFNWLIGNTDGHIKNYSLLYNSDLKKIRLAPAYDIVSTTIYPSSREMAFAIGGERNIEIISDKHFKIAASEIGLGGKIAIEVFEKMRESFEHALHEAALELAEAGLKDAPQVCNAILNSRHLK